MKANNQTKASESRYSFDVVSNLQVCNNTAEWVRMYGLFNELWDGISELLNHQYGEQGDELFEKKFDEAMRKVHEEIFDGINSSIFESLGRLGNKTIL